MSARSGAGALLRRDLVLGLVTADMLTGKPKLFGDLGLLNALLTSDEDGPAKRKPCFGHMPTRGQVSIAGRNDFAHLARHLHILTLHTRMWPQPMMPYLCAHRNMLQGNLLRGIV